MSHTPHELAEEFPDKAALIHKLKTENPHFARLAEEYHDINRQVHRAETNVEPMDDMAETALRQKRSALKDELYAILRGD